MSMRDALSKVINPGVITESVEQLDELIGKGKLPAIEQHYKKKKEKYRDLSNHHSDRYDRTNDEDDLDDAREADSTASEAEGKEKRASLLKKIYNANSERKKIKSDYEAHKKTMKESEQLDELSKATLGRYINRAINDVRSSNQAIGVRRERFPKSFASSIKIRKQEMGDTDFKYDERNRLEAKNRENGIRRAVKKLTKD